MVCQWGPDITPQRIEEIARQHDLTVLAIHRSALTGGTLVQFRINGNRQTAAVVRAMEAERIVSQPNYVYLLGQAAPETAAAESGAGDSQQYVANKLRLAEVHKIATGKGVTVAVIDSEIDNAHPELANGIAEKFDAVGQPDQPHTHGTGMAGAIVSRQPPDRRRARRERARRPCVQHRRAAAVAAGDHAPHRRRHRMGARPRARASST